MPKESELPKFKIKLMVRGPFPYSGPTKAELNYWQQLFNQVFPGQVVAPCLMDYDYIEVYIPWLEKEGPEKAQLAAVYRQWLKYLALKRERERVYSAAWGKTWNEGFARRVPLHELHQLAELAGRKAQREFDYPDEPTTGIDPALDSLRLRYRYSKYSRAEIRAAVEEELRQLSHNLGKLRNIGSEKFNHDILPAINNAIGNFLLTRPRLEIRPVVENGRLKKGVKETTQLKSLIKLADMVNPIFHGYDNLQKTIETKSEYLDELAWRLNKLVVRAGIDLPPKSEEEIRIEKWQRDYEAFENSKSLAFDLVRLAWERLGEFAGIELTFNPAYTDQEKFQGFLHLQEKRPHNSKVLAFCQAWLTFLKTADLEAAKNTIWGAGLLDLLNGKIKPE